MELPPLENLSIQDLLRYLDEWHPNDEQMTQDEKIWWGRLVHVAAPLAKALDDLTYDDIMQLWVKKKRISKPKGNRFHRIYFDAWINHKIGGAGKEVVFREIVVPYMIEKGEIQIVENGEPDPIQIEIAEDNFSRSFDRMEKKFSIDSP